jgi:hypothetical protein
LKAFYVAFALIVTIGPVSANGLSLSGRSVEVAQTEPSRLYRAEWLSAHARSYEAEAPLLASGAHGEPDADIGAADAAEDQLSADLKAKIRAIIAVAREEVHTTSNGSRLLRSRVRVSCSVRQVVAKRKPSLAATPALMLSERAGAQPTRVASTLEACTIKLLQIRRSESTEPAKREFSIELPSSLSDGAH